MTLMAQVTSWGMRSPMPGYYSMGQCSIVFYLAEGLGVGAGVGRAEEHLAGTGPVVGVGGGDQAHFFHLLDQASRAVVAYSQLALQHRGRDVAVLLHKLDC